MCAGSARCEQRIASRLGNYSAQIELMAIKAKHKVPMADDKFAFCRSVSMPAIKWIIADVERVKLKALTEGQRSIPQQDPLR